MEVSSSTSASKSSHVTPMDTTTKTPTALSASVPSVLVMTCKNFLGGLVGGGCEAVVGYPLETVKARMQTQQVQVHDTITASTSTKQVAFRGPMDCLQSSIRNDGFLSLYRGAMPQVFRSAISASLLFGLVGQYRYLYNNYIFSDNPKNALIAATVSAGFTEGFLYTPFEIIKIRMQTLAHLSEKPLTNWQCVKEVYHQSGVVKGLYRGFLPTAKREMVGNTAYFLAYETCKTTLMNKFCPDHLESANQESFMSRPYQIIAFSGGVAGFTYWTVVFPIDTIKSVMQGDSLTNPRYHGVVDCAEKLYKEGGVQRFYRGITPSLVRAFPANAITFVAFESTLSYLNRYF